MVSTQIDAAASRTGGGSAVGMVGVVGVVGTGIMGEPIGRQLLAAGYRVVAFNRTRVKAEKLIEFGATVAESLPELGRLATVVVLALPSGVEVRGALTELLTTLASGVLIIDTSTIAPHESRDHYRLCADKGISYVDAPVSGGPVAIDARSLSIMAGGDADALDRAEAILAAFAGRFVRCGGPGAGSVAKACNQLIVASTIEIVAEALVLAKASGVDPALVRDALLGGFAASRVLELHGLRMLEGNYVPGGRARLQLKDIDIIRSMANAHAIPLEAFEAAAGRFERLVESGGGELDHSAVATVLESDAGVRLTSVAGARSAD
jgi:2-hydroxy-3-oxopropionate reductase